MAQILATLRSWLCKPPESRLPRHSQAEQPLLYPEQVQRLYDLALMWGEVAAIYEQDLQNLQDLAAGRLAMQREAAEQSRNAEHVLRVSLREILQSNGIWRTHRYLIEPLMQQANYWVQWRIRGARGGVYGKCQSVIERAEWCFKEYLLTLDHQADETQI